MKLVRLTCRFLRVCAAILGVTGLLKLVSLFGHARILTTPDPLLGIQTRFVLLVLGLVEVFLAVVLYRQRNIRQALWLAVWAGFNFVMYRVFLTLSGGDVPCPCLGTVFGWMKLNSAVVEGSLLTVSCFMFLGGCMLLWRLPKQFIVADQRS